MISFDYVYAWAESMPFTEEEWRTAYRQQRGKDIVAMKRFWTQEEIDALGYQGRMAVLRDASCDAWVYEGEDRWQLWPMGESWLEVCQ